MKKISDIILKHKIIVLSLFIILTIISIFLNKGVKINYSLSDYLPKDSSSLVALEEMGKSYPSVVPNVKLLIPDITIDEALSYKEKLITVDGVNDVLWADNYFNLIDPNFDANNIKDWYKNSDALFQISIDTANTSKVLNKIKKVIPTNSLLAGNAVDIGEAQNNMIHEVNTIMLYVVPIILIILLLTTSSWFEPILFLITIGISIIINMGTNIIFGEISSVTKTTAAILQLAVSMDYAIFLLHRFAGLRRKGQNVVEAMGKAMAASTPVILASALTTILGFLALVLMKFKIGPDLGLVLAKGIIFSLVSVLFLLPVLAIYTYKLIDKTHHKSFIPSFKDIGKGIVKIRFGVVIIILLLIVPSFIASSHNTFLYGSSGINSEDSKVYKDTVAINKEFGVNNQMILLIPVNNYDKELQLDLELKNLDKVVSVNSFVTTFGLTTPISYLPKELVSQFISSKYSRIIINTDVPEEGKSTFSLIDKIKNITHKYFGNNYYLAGVSPTNYDMKQIVTRDNLIVNIAAIISIIIVLIITFKAVLVPLILISTIEAAIWINLSIAYLAGYSLNYIGYLVVSTVQLGATVDYAILFAKRYLEKRKTLDKKETAIKTISDTAPSILSSAIILGIAGLGLGLISTNGVISELGSLVGRGALLSSFMVLLFIPAMFIICDKILFRKVIKESSINSEENSNSNV